MYVDGPNKKRGRERLEEAAEISRRLGAQPYLNPTQKAMAGLS